MRVVGPSGQPPYNATTCGVSPDSPCLLQDALSQCVGSSAVQVTLQFLHGTYHQDQVTVTGGESTPISITLELLNPQNGPASIFVEQGFLHLVNVSQVSISGLVLSGDPSSTSRAINVTSTLPCPAGAPPSIAIHNVTCTGFPAGCLLVMSPCSSLNVSNSIWSHNSAAQGGAIFGLSSEVSIQSSWFFNNSASFDGSQPQLSDSFLGGGAIFVQTSSLSVVDTLFSSNMMFTSSEEGILPDRIVGGGGSSIVVESTGPSLEVMLQEVQVFNDRNTFQSANFTGSVNIGGAVMISYAGSVLFGTSPLSLDVHILGCNFTGNELAVREVNAETYVQASGGAASIFVPSFEAPIQGTLIVQSSTFLRNAFMSSTASSSPSRFTGGGAISMRAFVLEGQGSVSMQETITQCVFEENIVNIYDQTSQAKVLFNGGGAVYLISSGLQSTVNLHMVDCALKGNSFNSSRSEADNVHSGGGDVFLSSLGKASLLRGVVSNSNFTGSTVTLATNQAVEQTFIGGGSLFLLATHFPGSEVTPPQSNDTLTVLVELLNSQFLGNRLQIESSEVIRDLLSLNGNGGGSILTHASSFLGVPTVVEMDVDLCSFQENMVTVGSSSAWTNLNGGGAMLVVAVSPLALSSLKIEVDTSAFEGNSVTYGNVSTTLALFATNSIGGGALSGLSTAGVVATLSCNVQNSSFNGNSLLGSYSRAATTNQGGGGALHLYAAAAALSPDALENPQGSAFSNITLQDSTFANNAVVSNSSYSLLTNYSNFQGGGGVLVFSESLFSSDLRCSVKNVTVTENLLSVHHGVSENVNFMSGAGLFMMSYSGVEAAFNLSVTDSRFEANTLHAENNFGISGSSVGGAGLYSFAYASGGTPVLNATVSNSWFVSNVAHIPNNVAQAEGNFNGGAALYFQTDNHGSALSKLSVSLLEVRVLSNIVVGDNTTSSTGDRSGGGVTTNNYLAGGVFILAKDRSGSTSALVQIERSTFSGNQLFVRGCHAPTSVHAKSRNFIGGSGVFVVLTAFQNADLSALWQGNTWEENVVLSTDAYAYANSVGGALYMFAYSTTALSNAVLVGQQESFVNNLVNISNSQSSSEGEFAGGSAFYCNVFSDENELSSLSGTAAQVSLTLQHNITLNSNKFLGVNNSAVSQGSYNVGITNGGSAVYVLAQCLPGVANSSLLLEDAVVAGNSLQSENDFIQVLDTEQSLGSNIGGALMVSAVTNVGSGVVTTEFHDVIFSKNRGLVKDTVVSDIVSTGQASASGPIQNGGASSYTICSALGVGSCQANIVVNHAIFSGDEFQQQGGRSQTGLSFIGGGSLFVEAYSFSGPVDTVVRMDDVVVTGCQSIVTGVISQNTHIGGGFGYWMAFSGMATSQVLAIHNSAFVNNMLQATLWGSEGATYMGGGALFVVSAGADNAQVPTSLDLQVSDSTFSRSAAMLLNPNATPSPTASVFCGGGGIFSFSRNTLGPATENVTLSQSSFVANAVSISLLNSGTMYAGGGGLYAVTRSLFSSVLAFSANAHTTLTGNNATLLQPNSAIPSGASPVVTFGGGGLFVVSPVTPSSLVTLSLSTVSILENAVQVMLPSVLIPAGLRAGGGGLTALSLSSPAQGSQALQSVMDKVVFRGNSASGQAPSTALQTSGGAADFQNLRALLIYCHADGNSATNGGAFHFDQNSPAQLNSTEIIGNFATSGGGLYSLSSVSAEDLTCSSNNATEQGGCMYLAGASTLSQSWFTDNMANTGGGLFSTGSVTIFNCTMTSNLATFAGGAVFVIGNGPVSIISLMARQNMCSHGIGGACYLDLSGSLLKDTPLFMSNSVFDENQSAGMHGGALFLGGSSGSSPVSISRTNFIRNMAKFSGGAIIVTDAMTVSFQNCLFQQNSASHGGVGRFSDFSSVQFSDQCQFNDNTATLEGGVFHCRDESLITVDNAAFDSNSVYEGPGGAVSLSGSSSFVGTQLVARDSFASSKGGFLYMSDKSKATLSTSIFQDHVAQYGGVVYSISTSSQSDVSGAEPTLVLSNVHMSYNAAQFQGGALWTQANGVSFHDNVYISGNSAHTGGGLFVGLGAPAATSSICDSPSPPISVVGCGFQVAGIVNFESNTARSPNISTSVIDGSGGGIQLGLLQEGGPIGFQLHDCPIRLPEGAVEIPNGCTMFNAEGSSQVCFSSNEGLFARNIGTLPRKVPVPANIAFQTVSPGDTVLLQATVVDFWGQRLASNLLPIVFECGDQSGVVHCDQAVDVQVTKNGLVNGTTTFSAIESSLENHVNFTFKVYSSRLISGPCESLNVQVSQCNHDTKFNPSESKCELCDSDTYSIGGLQESCTKCPQNMVCNTGYFSMNPNYWPAISQSVITPVRCPYNFCHQTVRMTSSVLPQQGLCTADLHRRSDSVMCGTCEDGYVEWDHYCVRCEKGSGVHVRALALILLEILAETFVIHLFSQGKQSAAETRILLFFVQAGGLIFYPQTVLNSIFALFNFQSQASYLSASDECPFYVSGLQELITQIVRPIVFFVALGFMFLLHKLLVWILSAKCLCGRVTRTSRKWLFFNLLARGSSGWHYFRTTLMLLLGIYWSLLQNVIFYFLRTDVPGRGSFNTLIPSIQYSECNTHEDPNCVGTSSAVVFILVFVLLCLIPFVLLTLMILLKRRQSRLFRSLNVEEPVFECCWMRHEPDMGFCIHGMIEDGQHLRVFDKEGRRLKDPSWFRKLFGAYAGCYRRPWYFWGVVQLIRLMVLGAILLSLARSQDLANLHFALFLAMLCFIALHCFAWPYSKSYDNWIELSQLVLLMVIAAIFSTFPQTFENSNVTALNPGTVLFLLGFGLISLALLWGFISRFRTSPRKARERLRQQAAAVSHSQKSLHGLPREVSDASLHSNVELDSLVLRGGVDTPTASTTSAGDNSTTQQHRTRRGPGSLFSEDLQQSLLPRQDGDSSSD